MAPSGLYARICHAFSSWLYRHRRTVLWCSDAAAPGKLNSAQGRKRAAGVDLVHKLAIGIRHVIQTETMGNSSQSQLVYKATHWSSSFAIGSYNSFSNL